MSIFREVMAKNRSCAKNRPKGRGDQNPASIVEVNNRADLHFRMHKIGLEEEVEFKNQSGTYFP